MSFTNTLCRALIGCVILTATASSTSAAPGQPSLLDGHWEGTLLQSGQRLPIRFDFSSAGATRKGRFSVDRWRAMDYPLDGVQLAGRRVRFHLGDNAFDGTLNGPHATGTFKGDDGKGTFDLHRVTPTALPYDEVPVTFRNGAVTLAGTLALPRAPARHAAVVLIHGSGPQSRWGTNRYVADRFARAGIAALAYDKRGSGDSGGDWRTATYADLARDALAAVALLAARPDIDPARIGVHGHC